MSDRITKSIKDSIWAKVGLIFLISLELLPNFYFLEILVIRTRVNLRRHPKVLRVFFLGRIL